MTMKVHRWKSITALAVSLALAFGAAPSQAATLVDNTKGSAGLSASDLSKLPLTNRHLTRREKANLEVVLILFLGQFLPDIHRALKKITVHGDVVSIELSIQGTFLGPFDTPVGVVKPTGGKVDFPTADFWYLRNGKVEVFDCHIAFTTLFAQLGILPDYASAVGTSAPGK
jgi:hypothetical protein